jgi:hypothetical protein
MIPYANPADRARALYRIPTAPRRNRTLEICHSRESLLSGFAWPGDGHRCLAIGDVAQALALPAESFDLLILHRTLDDLMAASSRFDAARFIGDCVELLVPGGLIAGCIDNRNDPRRRLGRRAATRFSPQRIQRLLDNAGLDETRLFNLLPNCDAPMKLVDIDPATSRIAFRRELQTERRYMSRPAHLARHIVIESGLSRHIESSIFFWGYRPC